MSYQYLELIVCIFHFTGSSSLWTAMALFKGDTTAWDDIQIKMGNFAARDPKGPSNEELFLNTLDKSENIAAQDFVDTLLKESKSSTVEDEDLVSIRRQRIEQLMKQATMTASQSTVRRITRESYVAEVTEGSKSAVIVVMMDRRGGTSFDVEGEVKKLSKEWVAEIAPSKGWSELPARFYVGDVDELINSEFPAKALPFAVIYAEGVCTEQMANATAFGIKQSMYGIYKGRGKTNEQTASQVSSSEDDWLRKEIAMRRQNDKMHASDEDVSDDEKTRQRSKGYSSSAFSSNVLRQK